ncbi:MAG TPA: hypothetical protein VFC46_03045 [Humisphaera sp.]|nr:hypothetical protein [Humisphaera sp.]
MDIAEIRALLEARPFRPFNLLLKDGRKLPVDKPYFLGWADDFSFMMHTSVGGGLEQFHPTWVGGVDFEDPEEIRWKNRSRPVEVM